MGDDVLLTCDSYLINDETLALEPFFIGKIRTKIIMIDGIRYSEESPIRLLEKACLRYGSTKQGRIDAVKEKMNYMHRTPLIITPFSVGALPTVSSENLSCVWIFNHPFTIEELEKGKSAVKLLNGEIIIVPVSKHSLLNQKNKLHSALNMFKKFQTIQHTGISNENYYENQRQSIQKNEIVATGEWATQVAETHGSYDWKGKRKAK